MKLQRTLPRLGILAALALLFVLGSQVMPAQSADSEQISKLLAQAKSEAVLAEDDAASLDSFTRSTLSWKHHGFKIEQMRDHINALGQIHKQLADARVQGSAWQQLAIDQIEPLLQGMADNLSLTINHLNQNQTNVHMPAYREYVHANHELASRTAGMIREFVDYDEAKSKTDALEAKLELATEDKKEQ